MFQNAGKLDHIHLFHDCHSSCNDTSSLWDFFKALPCFCLIMQSLKNDLKLDCVRVPGNVNHALYIYLHTALQTLLHTTFSKQNATNLCGIVQTFCCQCAQNRFKLYQNVNTNHLASQYFKQLIAVFIKLLCFS